ncbi:hypothetical protein [Brachybacterium paraconglomeratum]|uniref:hypothetical protein n=1 Tax=Brachybacterium paraconglomeratum TaxID=173362 RepID=UPI0022AF3BCE|nr:hypothetical protein [Brachybacterium paraconglomeratum]MCZ4326729.1 hypothetical protein [Brachybacterium paraconglomeratum]
MFYENLGERGRPLAARKNLKDFLRLTLAAVEVVATRREVLDTVADPDRLPRALRSKRHAVYETGVVYEFSQLARADCEAHHNASMWERPVLTPRDTIQRIDMSLFRTVPLKNLRSNATRGLDSLFPVETRIEFGKLDGDLLEEPMRGGAGALYINGGDKLVYDARKLAELTASHHAGRAEDDRSEARYIENFIILWKELDGRRTNTPADARLTQARARSWLPAARNYAVQETDRLARDGHDVEINVEAVASSSLSTFRQTAFDGADDKLSRSAFAAVFSVHGDQTNKDEVIAAAQDAPAAARIGDRT